MEQIAVFFSSAGVPIGGLSPTVDIWERNGTKRITAGRCTEIAGGFYIYNFDTYSTEKQYLYLFDGTATLSDADRYIAGNNDLDSYSNKATWGRTVAANIDYKPHFKALEDKFSSMPQTDLTGIMKEISTIKKTVTLLSKKTNDEEINTILGTIGNLEQKVTGDLGMTKEEMKKHIEEFVGSTVSTMTQSIVKSLSEGNLSTTENLTKLEQGLVSRLDTVTTADVLNTNLDNLNKKLEDLVHGIVTNYLKDNVMNMFDFSFKRKNDDSLVKEVSVDPEEEFLAKLTA